MAGRLRLAATGAQDVWLTGEPQFSYFLTNFKKHTKFAFDLIESQFDGDIDFDQIIECRIPGDKGDLVRNMTLKVILTDPKPDDNSENDMVWSPSVITNMIEYVDLFIGGQPIERLTGEYIYIHQQLHNTDDDIDQSLYFLNGHGNYLSYSGEYTYFLDLPFYFYRNPSLAIPTCALTKQIIEIRVKIKPLINLVRNISSPPNADDTISDVTASIKKFSIDTEFAYVTPEERDYLITRPLDYMITQLQMAKFKMKPGENEKSVMLNFQHPVKELFFVSQNKTNGNVPNLYNEIVEAELRFNNEIVFKRDGLFLTYEQALKYHVNSPNSDTFTPESFNGLNNVQLGPSKFGMYSFSLNPEAPYPTGQVNMSRIVHKLFKFNIKPINEIFENETRIYAVNYNVMRIHNGLAGLKF